MSLRTLWGRLLGHSAHARPDPATNPIQSWLDAAGLPWRATRADLAARFGIHADNPYHWNLVPLAVQPPPLSAMLWPLGFQAFPRFSPAMPPVTLSTHIWMCDDAEANIRAAAAQFAPHLGARSIEDRWNTRRVEWRHELANLTLIAWPPRMQTGPKLTNPAHARDKRLVTACSLTVQTGWRPPLSPQDRAWLDGFAPLGATSTPPPARRRPQGDTMFVESDLEFMRQPPQDLARFRGAFGLSADRQALIVCEDSLYILPLAQVETFEVTRILPAKGGGGSTLLARCATGYPACPAKSIKVAQGALADDLTDIATRLAAACGKPLHLGEYDYDV